MIPTDKHEPESCRAVSETLARIADKWTVLVVELLKDGPMRFNEIRRTIDGISQRMLTLTLRDPRARWSRDANRLSDDSSARGI